MVQGLFFEVASVLALAVVLAAAARILRQPLIVSFLAAGILAGPAAFHLVRSEEFFGTLAELGIALLLFTVGLKLDPRLVRTLGPVASMTGVGQIVFTSALGFTVALLFGFTVVQALYVAVALTFSSTIIITKLLSDKGELESLHGRVAVGFLIIQDVFVVVVLVALPLIAASGRGEEAGGWWAAARVLAAAAGLFLVVYILMRWVFPRLFAWLAGSRELLVLAAVAWGVAAAAVAEGVGLGVEMGAFVAGVALAPNEFREAIGSRMTGLRDFLLLFFFVTLGAGMDLSLLAAQVPAAVVLSLFVLVGNPLIVVAIMGFMGFRRRTGFLAGLTVAQISEFSLVLAALGMGLGHIGEDVLGLVTLVGLVTISVSAYLILFSDKVYAVVGPILGVFERRAPWREEQWQRDQERRADRVDVVVFGCGRFGRHLLRRLQEGGLKVMGVDVDSNRLRQARQLGIDVIYGDAEDEEFPLTLSLASVDLVVSTIADLGTNRVLAGALSRSGFQGRFIVTAHTSQEAESLKRSGLETMEPFRTAGEEVAWRLVEWLRGQDRQPDRQDPGTEATSGPNGGRGGKGGSPGPQK